ncbi:hypothetical protein NKH77_25215 [Streptomyces sp. M19]
MGRQQWWGRGAVALAVLAVAGVAGVRPPTTRRPTAEGREAVDFEQHGRGRHVGGRLGIGERHAGGRLGVGRRTLPGCRTRPRRVRNLPN